MALESLYIWLPDFGIRPCGIKAGYIKYPGSKCMSMGPTLI